MGSTGFSETGLPKHVLRYVVYSVEALDSRLRENDELSIFRMTSWALSNRWVFSNQ